MLTCCLLTVQLKTSRGGRCVVFLGAEGSACRSGLVSPRSFPPGSTDAGEGGFGQSQVSGCHPQGAGCRRVDNRGSAGRWLGTFRNPFSRVFLKPPSLLSNWIVIPEPSPSPCARSGSQQSSQSLPVPWDVPKLAAPQKLLPSPSKTPTADFGPWEKHHHWIY